MAAAVVRRFCRVLPQALNPCSRRTVLGSYNFKSKRLFHTSRHLLTERKYSKDHEWITLENDIGTIGVTDYAQSKLGDVVYVDLPEVGQTFEEGGVVGALESVKAASDVYTPVPGEVTEINSKLSENPSLINESPFEEGWLIKIRVSGEPAEPLLSEEEYQKFVEESEEE